ncbi:MAG TPA: LacI family DNA-binding transcriptional regulator [Micrococcaceae bacterium]|nr:LacI family DNA-binding transcriptional regulator [Micrococcaceae bacterium]
MNRVTIAGLADQLGISKASVSYALNGQPGVSELTRQKVLMLARELGWYPSSSARALSHARADVIGIVLSREPEMIGSEPYYMSLLAGIESVLSAADVSLLLRMVGSAGTRDLAVYERWAGERRVDGVILFDHLDRDPRPALLDRLQLPFVLHGASRASADLAGTVVDQAADAATLVGHLHGLGHRRIAHISGPLALVHERVRKAAVLADAAALSMAVQEIECDYTMAGAAAAIRALMGPGSSGSSDSSGSSGSAAELPTALIFGNDLMAMGGAAALKELGIDIPAAVSVVSWDDSILCQVGSPAVTALQRDPEEQGRSSARLLLDVIAGRDRQSISSPPGRLVVRASTGRGPTG